MENVKYHEVMGYLLSGFTANHHICGVKSKLARQLAQIVFEVTVWD